MLFQIYCRFWTRQAPEAIRHLVSEACLDLCRREITGHAGFVVGRCRRMERCVILPKVVQWVSWACTIPEKVSTPAMRYKKKKKKPGIKVWDIGNQIFTLEITIALVEYTPELIYSYSWTGYCSNIYWNWKQQKCRNCSHPFSLREVICLV